MQRDSIKTTLFFLPVTPGNTHTGCVCCPWLCCRHLPNGLLPGPLLYIAAGSADLFVTTTAALELEAYKYSNLVAAAGDKQEPGRCFFRGGGGKKSMVCPLRGVYTSTERNSV
jgi:hypothetical protein